MVVAGAVFGAVATNSHGAIQWGAYGAIGFFVAYFLIVGRIDRAV